jgi:hypothetical protein
MIDDAETKMRTNAAVRVELKTWVLSPQNSGMQNSGCFRLFVLDLGFSMFVFIQGGETGIGKMAAEKVWVPPAGRGARGGILNKPRRQMSFLSSSDSCELAPLRVCELASILCDVLCVSFWVMPRMLGKFPESFRISAILDM